MSVGQEKKWVDTLGPHFPDVSIHCGVEESLLREAPESSSRMKCAPVTANLYSEPVVRGCARPALRGHCGESLLAASMEQALSRRK
eukprot:6191370-Pleurochrysis_carterae.AAC.2